MRLSGSQPGLCISAAGRSTVTRYIVWPERQTWTCAQRVPMHGNAVGTATPKQPKGSGIQRFNKDALKFLFLYFHK